MKAAKFAPLLVLAIALATQGCNPFKENQPSKEQIMGAVANAVPPYVSVVDIVPEFLPGESDRQWKINIKATIAPKEDLMTLPSVVDVQDANNLSQRINAIIVWHNGYEMQKAPDAPDTEIETAETPQFLKTTSRKGQDITVYGKLTAEKQVDRWNISIDSLDLPSMGRPMGDFGTGNGTFVQIGTPAADDALQKLRKTAESDEAKEAALLAQIEREKKEKAEKLEALKKAEKTAFCTACMPGKRYVGTFSDHGFTEKVAVDFEQNEMDGALIAFKVARVEKPDQWAKYKGHIESDYKGNYFVNAQKVATLGGDRLGFLAATPRAWANALLNSTALMNGTVYIFGSHLEMKCGGLIEADARP